MDIINKSLVIKMPDGSEWAIPIHFIAQHRSNYYAITNGECDGDIQRHLREKTIPLFESNSFEIEDWAANNINWSEISRYATQIKAPETDFQEGWVNGEKEVRDV